MLNLPFKNVIIAPCENKILYSIKENGELDFSIEFDDYISTSPSILNINDQILIFIGLNNGKIYAIDIFGEIQFEYNVSSKVIGSILFSDFNNDFEPEIISVNSMGDLSIFNLDGHYYNNFPIEYDFPYSSPCLIDDIDSDLDLEIFCGTTNSLVGIDIKDSSYNNTYWNMHGGNHKRNNYYKIEYNCNYGDMDSNDMLNIFDIILLVECIIEDNCSICSDFNIDGFVNILDIVNLTSFILYEN